MWFSPFFGDSFFIKMSQIIDKSDIADIITPIKKPMITVVMLCCLYGLYVSVLYDNHRELFNTLSQAAAKHTYRQAKTGEQFS